MGVSNYARRLGISLPPSTGEHPTLLNFITSYMNWESESFSIHDMRGGMISKFGEAYLQEGDGERRKSDLHPVRFGSDIYFSIWAKGVECSKHVGR